MGSTRPVVQKRDHKSVPRGCDVQQERAEQDPVQLSTPLPPPQGTLSCSWVLGRIVTHADLQDFSPSDLQHTAVVFLPQNVRTDAVVMLRYHHVHWQDPLAERGSAATCERVCEKDRPLESRFVEKGEGSKRDRETERKRERDRVRPWP